MAVKVYCFGPLKDIIPQSELEVQDVDSVEELLNNLTGDYPQLNNHKYLVSVNANMADRETKLQKGDEVALLPPFAGG